VTGRPTPSIDEVRGWLQSLSTWGRWGADDDLGTLNHIGSEERAAALRLPTGEPPISCALAIRYERPAHGPAGDAGSPHPAWSVPTRFVVQDGAAAPDPGKRHPAYDAFLLAPHGPLVTHLDAPGHTVLDGRSYNGLPASTATAPGPKRGSIESVRQGIVGRGVLLDVPALTGRDWLDDGEAIFPEDLDAAETRAGVSVRRGDILFVRTGYRKRLPGGPQTRYASRPGLQAACLPWLAEREVAVLGADVAIDVVPHGYDDLGMPIHTVGMWALGLWLIDNCALDELSEACGRAGRREFLAVVAPLVLASGTGSPINPVALL
jgi:kynurenine formamidase